MQTASVAISFISEQTFAKLEGCSAQGEMLRFMNVLTAKILCSVTFLELRICFPF